MNCGQTSPSPPCWRCRCNRWTSPAPASGCWTPRSVSRRRRRRQPRRRGGCPADQTRCTASARPRAPPAAAPPRPTRTRPPWRGRLGRDSSRSSSVIRKVRMVFLLRCQILFKMKMFRCALIVCPGLSFCVTTLTGVYTAY